MLLVFFQVIERGGGPFLGTFWERHGEGLRSRSSWHEDRAVEQGRPGLDFGDRGINERNWLVWLEAGSNLRDGRGVDLVLLDLDAGVEGLRGVVRENGNSGLGNDRAGVHPGVHVVHGTSTFGGTCRHGLGPGVKTGETGEEGGVYI